MIKSIFYYALACCILIACHDNKTHEQASHAHDHHNHNHAHDHHNHNHANGNKQTHDHAAEAQANPDVIFLPVDKAKQIGIKSQVLSLKNLQTVVPATGRIELPQESECMVVAPVSGIVHQLQSWTPGRTIKANQDLFYISSTQMHDGDPVAITKVAYENALSEYERAERLIKNQLISQSEFIAIKEHYEKTKIAFDGVASKQSDKGTIVKSNLNGMVSEYLTVNGSYVERGQPLIKLVKNSKLYLHVDVSQRYVKYLNDVTSANFTTTYNDEVYQLTALDGRLLSYGKQINANSNFIPMVFSFNATPEVVPGTCVEVKLLCNSAHSTLSVPNSAITEEQGLYFVYLQLCSETYTKREVKLGMNNGVEVEIIEGLKPGEKVVTSGAYHIKLASMSNAIPGHSHEH
ncbi:MAG: efflux RND transporter periplasmic adaptor subunit [Bacteroidaceae bacterium]|nr:efflux RND transporter periplasmic adaptor subunit [Bacteroidaceae bacterium]